jgi:hypothetical protein
MILASIGALLVATGVAYWLVLRRRAPKPDRNPRQPNAAPGGFGAVEIRIRGGACQAARSLEGQRFLARKAPVFPLPECTAAKCSCTFVKLSDRRTEGRRLEHGGLSASMFLASSRRTKRDRRRVAKPPRQN